MNKINWARLISRILHLLAAGYIVGHLTSFYWASHELMYAIETETPATFYLSSGLMVTITGFIGLVLILLQSKSQKYYVTWEYIIFAKAILSLLLTRISDWLVLKSMGAEYVEELMFDPKQI